MGVHRGSCVCIRPTEGTGKVIVIYSLLNGGDRVWLGLNGGGKLKVVRCECPKEAQAVFSHLSGLDYEAGNFKQRADARLAKINLGMRH